MSKLSGEKRKMTLQSAKKYKSVKKPIKPAIIIYTEGKVTEPTYFHYLKKYCNNLIIHVHGCGYNTKSLVRHAKGKMKDKLSNKDKERVREYYKEINEHFSIHKDTCEIYQQVWCVFDADDFRTQYQEAIVLAKKYKFFHAVSNQSFELWLFLHSSVQYSQIHRHDYEKKLTDKYGIKYDKSEGGMESFFNHFFSDNNTNYIDRAKMAIHNAFILEKGKKTSESIDDLLCNYCIANSKCNCYECSPYTTMHHLVMLILFNYLDNEQKMFVKNNFPISECIV